MAWPRCRDPVYKRPSCRRTATRTRTAASGATRFRATLSLTWPLVLTNLAQALGTTDVIMMGRLGPAALAAGALGTNLYFAS